MRDTLGCVRGDALPIIVEPRSCDRSKHNVDQLAEEIALVLKRAYVNTYREPPSPQEYHAWKSFAKNVLDELLSLNLSVPRY